MSKADKNTERVLDLQDRLASDTLSALEQQELDALTTDDANGSSTYPQQEYIETLLDKLGADLCDYGYVGDVTALSFDDASYLIDVLKDDVTAAGAWDY